MKITKLGRHLRESEALAFIEGRLKRDARRRVVRHLVTGCRPCLDLALKIGEGSVLFPLAEDVDYDACLDKAEASLPQLVQAWSKENARKKSGVAKIRESRGGVRPLKDSWAGVEVILDLSFSLRYSNPTAMLELAANALRAAEKLLPQAHYPEVVLADLRGRAAAELANAERVNERFLWAQEALGRARAYAEQGTGNLLLQGRIDEIEGTLRKDERRTAASDHFLARASHAYLRLGENGLAARTLITQAVNLIYGDRPNAAVPLLRQSVDLLASGGDPQLLAVARYNLIVAFIEADDIPGASRLLIRSNLRVIFRDDPLNLLRLRWLEARILSGRQRWDDAVTVLLKVRKEFEARGLDYVAAVVGLEQAKVLLLQGNHQEVHELAVELHTRARVKKVHLGARQALHCFELVCRQRAATTRLAKALQHFLEESERRPRLRFDPEAYLLP
jgi:hypothetical protein